MIHNRRVRIVIGAFVLLWYGGRGTNAPHDREERIRDGLLLLDSRSNIASAVLLPWLFPLPVQTEPAKDRLTHCDHAQNSVVGLQHR